MRKYNLAVLYPWDETWYPMTHVGPFWTRAGATIEMAKQAQLFPVTYKFGITKNGALVYQED